MRELLSIFYSTAIAIVVFSSASRVATRFLAKAHANQIRSLELYLEGRPNINQAFENEWLRIEPYAHRLWEHMYKKSGKHAYPVSDQEIDTLIEDCLQFSITIKKALRREDRLLRTLSSKEKASLPLDEHAAWHQMYYGARYIMRDFKTLRMNTQRPTVK